MITPDDILEFWFPADQTRANQLWWGKQAQLDAEIRERFGTTLTAAKAGQLDAWAEHARGRLALIITLDQLSRNVYRDDPEAYASDERARALTREGLERGHDRELAPIERVFFYLPLEHSESLADQERCVALFRQLVDDVDPTQRERYAGFLDYAVRHRDIVARFGRFPHRNALLGRTSSPEELEFLTQPGSSF